MLGPRFPRRNRRFAAATATGLLLVLSACGGASGASTSPPPAATADGQVLVGAVEALHAGGVSAAQVGAADTAFGMALFERLCTAAPDRNLTISPASAAEALGMLDAGASGGTRTKLASLLHLPMWNAALVAALHAQTTALGAVPQVKVSNHVFERTGVRPTASTLDDLKTAYDADLRILNFRDPATATAAINTVISRDTDAMIPKLFESPLDPSTQTVLVNAIVLDAKWQSRFPSVQPGQFRTSDAKTVTSPLMQNPDGAFTSRSAAGWQSVVLPYEGGRLQAVALLPPGPASHSATACMTPGATTLTALTTGASQPAAVVLPKLDLSQTLPLTRDLAAMGLPLHGDYTGLGALDTDISEVLQKVVMKVDQNGTKAAAATGIAITSSARIGGQTVSFTRPFLLLLEDTATHTPLFLARVADPTQS